jgi:nucleoside-diphosphate-sugar epimerase
VARILIVGGGCRGRRLAGELLASGHAVRITTRAQARRAQIESTGAECWIGTPDRVATLRGALDGVTLACWLLGSARGSTEEMRALHGSRLEAFVRQLIDTTVRGFIYEAAGSAAASELAAGERIVRTLAAQNEIPAAVITADGADAANWLREARGAVETMLGAPLSEARSHAGGHRKGD